MKPAIVILLSAFCQHLAAQTDTMEWLLRQANRPVFNFHQLAGKTPKKDLLKFIKHSKHGDYIESDGDYDPEHDGSWETYILQFFEYCDLDRDGREDIVNSGWRYGYRWTQIAFNLGKNKYSAWLHLPGQIHYFEQTATETVILTYGEGCCGYSPDVVALVSFPKNDLNTRFKYRAFLEGIPFIKDSFPIAYKRPFKTRQAVSVLSSLPDAKDLETEEDEFCDLGCYHAGSRGFALQEVNNEGSFWFLVMMPAGTGLRYTPETFIPCSVQWQSCYAAVGWVAAKDLDFD